MAFDARANKGTFRRTLLDVLAVASGLIALFQFFISDNVSSQWFKPARDWVAERSNLSEELDALGSGWNRLVTDVTSPSNLFDTLSPWELVGLIAIAAISAGILGNLVAMIVLDGHTVFKGGPLKVNIEVIKIVGAFLVLAFPLWILWIGNVPLWVWPIQRLWPLADSSETDQAPEKHPRREIINAILYVVRPAHHGRRDGSQLAGPSRRQDRPAVGVPDHPVPARLHRPRLRGTVGGLGMRHSAHHLEIVCKPG
ncbi:hypothetical protein [Nonomuraea jiangxiensis]|uniref:hypothetical protein n=1 Tax=Nonomuraea jiangxiensis TaxID=633440 RepID=UPI00115FF01A|nr:hypothetical protein [Nonomuraea jiangxiensis]